MSDWLIDEIQGSLQAVPGSLERDQIVSLMTRAVRMRLSEPLTEAVAQTVLYASDSIERSLSGIRPLADVIWLEYDHKARARAAADVAEGGYAATADLPVKQVGALVATNPQEQDHLTIFLAWKRTSGEVFHSYALLHWNMHDFANHLPGDPRTAHERLMKLGRATLPDGLMTEMEIWHDFEAVNDPRIAEAVKQTTRDVMGEHLFLLAAMLMVNSTVVSVSPIEATPRAPVDDDEDGWGTEDIDGEQRNQFFFDLSVAKFSLPWRKAGFRISKLSDRHDIDWKRPRPGNR